MNPQPTTHPNHGGYRRSLWLVLAGVLSTTFSAAYADIQTRIVSINGNYATTHDAYLTVYPGDTVALSADQLDVDYYGTVTPQNRYVEDFQWSSDYNGSDICDPEYDCVGTNFDANSYGVNFYVPWDMQQYLTLTVQNRTDGSYDQITLVNGSYANGGHAGGGYTPPSDAYSDPYDYPEQGDFDFNRGLAGHGRWVYIHGERAFVPHSYATGWQPYQHGYWYWTKWGWTWHSYDPWGYVTDHYGYWRNHATYGWVWFAFPERRWHPAVVTWFHTDSGIGWYPYWNNYRHGYRHGYSHGYRDGYWDGFRAGLATSGYHWGWTYVSHSHFTSVNIYKVRVTNVHIHNYYGRAYRAGHYGVILRDHRTSHPRRFVETRIGRRIDATPTRVITRRGADGRQVHWVRPANRVQVPSEYRNVRRHAAERVRDHRRRVPVGSVVTPDGRVNRPSRPVVVAPRMPDRNGGYRPMPERSRRPSTEPRRPQPAPRPLPNRPAPNRPTYPAPSRPSNPAPSRPAPGRPNRPEPSRPAPSRPAPNRPSYPAPSRPAPSRPAPNRPNYPAPRRPEPSRPAPSRPAPSRPSYPAPSRPAPSRPAPSRPSYPAPRRPEPSRPAPSRPAPSRPSYPAPSRPAPSRPAPSRPSYPAPSRPSRPAPSRPAPSRPSRPRRGDVDLQIKSNAKTASVEQLTDTTIG